MEAPRAATHVRALMRDALLPVAVAFTLALVIQSVLARPYEIPSASMYPTIHEQDKIIVNRLIYRFRGIHRGDIIVFNPTRQARASCGGEVTSDVPFVKRVVGLPGDVVEVRGGRTYVNGVPFAVPQAVTPSYTWRSPRVPSGRLVVLGDNRDDSCDSHLWRGDPFAHRDQVIGEAEFTYWPLTRLAFLD